MKRFLKQHAPLQGGAMETGDHSKNGARPKSLTSRGNIKQIDIKRVIYGVSILLMCSACSPKDTNDAHRSKEDFIMDCLKMVVARDIKVLDYISEFDMPESKEATEINDIEEWFIDNFEYYHNLTIEQIENLKLTETGNSYANTRKEIISGNEINVIETEIKLLFHGLQTKEDKLDCIIKYNGKYYWKPLGW